MNLLNVLIDVVVVGVAGLLYVALLCLTHLSLFIRRPSHADDERNDLIVSDVIRRNELQAWFVAEHAVQLPATHACKQTQE